jgi:hypothetical protein
MSAVRNWLEEIGLAQYADAFQATTLTLIYPPRSMIKC